jgi:UTP--glucose-1-phosphate uridylyltransferase
VISKGKELIPQYFYESPELESELERRGKSELLEGMKRYGEANFHVVYQDEQLGDGHAILQAADWVESETVAILFGDDLFHGVTSGLDQLRRAQTLIGDPEAAFIALENIPKEQTEKYGIIEPERGYAYPHDDRLKKVSGLVEKPKPEDAPSTLGIVGKYIIPRSTVAMLPDVAAGQGGEIRLIDALAAQLGLTGIYGYECEGTRIDTGTPEGYKKAMELLG